MSEASPRVIGRPFTKGNSGNPQGCPSSAKILEELRTSKGALAKECWEYAIEGMRKMDRDSPSWRYCHGWVSDHTMGKVTASVDIQGEIGVRRATIDWSLVPIDQRRQILAALHQAGALAPADADDAEH